MENRNESKNVNTLRCVACNRLLQENPSSDMCEDCVSFASGYYVYNEIEEIINVKDKENEMEDND